MNSSSNDKMSVSDPSFVGKDLPNEKSVSMMSAEFPNPNNNGPRQGSQPMISLNNSLNIGCSAVPSFYLSDT